MTATVLVPPKPDHDRGNARTRAWLREFNSAWSRFADSRAMAYIFFAVLYIVPNVVLARNKLIWDDEFFTLYLSKTASWSELWRALSTGADQHPPSFYYLTHLIFKIFGTSHVTLRLTALFGFGLCCVCLYEIARQMLGRNWGVPAMLLPMTCNVFYYATEARGYGLELGFVTFSLLMWILATEGKQRNWTVPAIAVGLCLAVASHYYAVLFVLPLGLGELVKIHKRRRIDVAVCISLSAALIPVLIFSPIILKATSYSKHFWAVPTWGAILGWYPAMLGRMPFVLLAAAALTFLFKIPVTEDSRASVPEIYSPVVMAVTASALLPVVGVIIAELVTHAFTERYFIAAVPGSCILLVWGLKCMIRNGTAGPALACALCLILSGQEWRDLRAGQTLALRQVSSIGALLSRLPDGPIVMSEITVFHKLSFYARRDLAARLVYVADPHRSIRYLGHDTVDRGLLDLTPWFPLRVVWWHDWWSDHQTSFVYGPVHEWTWITFALREVGTAQLMDREVSQLLFDVKRTTVPDDDRVAGDPPGKPMLYDQMPTSGPSLCQIYMPTGECPVVDDTTTKAPIISYPEMYQEK
jgi:hypothetical protein